MSIESGIHEDPFRPDATRGSHRFSPDSEETMLARVDAEDQKNEAVNGYLKYTLSFLPEQLRSYRTMLPKLCALLPASEPLSTMLTHPDLLHANIFVDKAGVPVARRVWERPWLEPIALVIIPKFLDAGGESDAFYAPSETTVTKEEMYAHVYNHDRLATVRERDESTYEGLRGRIQRTRLRAAYREELERLRSPMCKAFNRDPNSFEQQLMRRVHWPENPENTSATFWAVKYLGESILDDSYNEQENETEEEPEEGG